MLNDKRAGMPISTERPMPRIVAGTDLMAALKQSIEKAKEETPKTAARQVAAAAAVPAQQSLLQRPKVSGRRKAARTSARCCCRLQAAHPRRKCKRNKHKTPARGKRRVSPRELDRR